MKKIIGELGGREREGGINMGSCFNGEPWDPIALGSCGKGWRENREPIDMKLGNLFQ
jgi:hypothetical protein